MSRVLSRYWAMLSVGTDGCRHLSAQRWNWEPYYEPDKERERRLWPFFREDMALGSSAEGSFSHLSTLCSGIQV